MADSKYYQVVRFSQKNGRGRVQAKNLTLEQARKWCNDPQTSSHTADKPRGCGGDEAMIQRWNEKDKHWFDGYEQMR
jgi:hypothetical protein